VSEWSKLKEKYGSWKMLGTDVVPLLWAEGDKIQLSLDILEEEALQQLHELDDCKDKLEAIREWYSHQIGNQVDPQDIIELGKILLAYKSRRDWWLWFFHPDYVEHRKMPGWTGFLPFFKFTCEVHGKVVDYPHGHRQRLICPECAKE